MVGSLRSCARATSGQAAPPLRSVMKSRRFTALCFPCFDRKDSKPRLRQEAAALRHFNPGYVAVGSNCCRLGMCCGTAALPLKHGHCSSLLARQKGAKTGREQMQQLRLRKAVLFDRLVGEPLHRRR